MAGCSGVSPGADECCSGLQMRADGRPGACMRVCLREGFPCPCQLHAACCTQQHHASLCLCQNPCAACNLPQQLQLCTPPALSHAATTLHLFHADKHLELIARLMGWFNAVVATYRRAKAWALSQGALALAILVLVVAVLLRLLGWV